ncbi:winged helix-turn-helix domain-containing protein [Natronorubrum sp. FCH18a]|uniref:winged helix-turn-helix domain-containing protein n=1 Tax=Natronorubrum sp. FCH18a TaxID=3447018 RepID=UPI003F513904
MSESATSPNGHREEQSTRIPRAIIHKQILDAAETNPDASMEDIATAVSGATADLVDHVLEEYGDPATAPAEEALEVDAGSTAAESTENGEETTGTGRDGVASETRTETEVTEKQREALRVIAERPDATQADIADILGVSSPSINKRVNSIDGFDWSDRRSFVEQYFDDPDAVARGETSERRPAAIERTDGGSRLPRADDRDAQIDELTQRLTAVERSLEETQSSLPAISDPEILHKVVHACLESDHISADEELAILHDLLGTDERSD